MHRIPHEREEIIMYITTVLTIALRDLNHHNHKRHVTQFNKFLGLVSPVQPASENWSINTHVTCLREESGSEYQLTIEFIFVMALQTNMLSTILFDIWSINPKNNWESDQHKEMSKKRLKILKVSLIIRTVWKFKRSSNTLTKLFSNSSTAE